jgi:hypothetical protein
MVIINYLFKIYILTMVQTNLAQRIPKSSTPFAAAISV